MAFTPIRMGFECQVFIGTPGTTAATQVLDLENVKVTKETKYAETPKKGDGTTIPQGYSVAVQITPKVTFNSLRVPSNTNLTTIRAAALSITPASRVIALKVTDAPTGTVLFSGDVDVKIDDDAPLGDKQDCAYECVPSPLYGTVATFA